MPQKQLQVGDRVYYITGPLKGWASGMPMPVIRIGRIAHKDKHGYWGVETGSHHYWGGYYRSKDLYLARKDAAQALKVIHLDQIQKHTNAYHKLEKQFSLPWTCQFAHETSYRSNRLLRILANIRAISDKTFS